ncbi:hypothetical protein NT2_01_06060 [Caenibius tardaugens NBRC 16725]|uniref:DUF1993 domain-containing protein n=1 Tax=Caenibius tardaugens NBRC 16725 TaxID=1219035 RepID=U2YID9_9SPHN|nr:DUF1993 domain-containing protein [Caenibius tardaugens]AZI36955.1 DUF1993 domain-containing protein [Caenibius tardaugens NBRC 16725]GAD47832.1 hypothetical protein NT2_01_06060 [Caenibius tardaugens NBRC 16725]
MPLSLHAALVPGWTQILRACRNWLDKAESHCQAHNLAAAGLIEARLIADMLPLNYQVKSLAVHSIGAIEGVRRGAFSPDWSEPPASFIALREKLDATLDALAGVTVAEMEDFFDRPVVFTVGSKFRLDFTAENFLLGFTQPNFHFHATTTYDILRAQGVALGKGDYLGAMPANG